MAGDGLAGDGDGDGCLMAALLLGRACTYFPYLVTDEPSLIVEIRRQYYRYHRI